MRIVLMYSTHRPSPEHITCLERLGDGIEVIVATDEPHAIEVCQQAQIILGYRYLRQVLPSASELAFVQSTAGGVDRLPVAELAAMRVRLCRCTVASTTIARHAVTCAWSIARMLPTAWARQQDRQWRMDFDWPAQPRRALVVGAGAIGQAIARLLSQDGIEVVGIRGSSPVKPVQYFDEMHGQAALPALLPDCDWCFLAMPLTDQTRNQFDEAMLSKLKRSAVLVNVARGEVIDTDALCRVMSQGHLAGAALDVLSPDAKDPEHAVWSTPRVMITPHVSAHCAERPMMIERFAQQQVRAFLDQQPLADEIDLATG